VTSKLNPLLSDSWFQIAWAIQRGEDPKRQDLIAALYRNEQIILPGDVQPYLARLLDKKIDQRGRPPRPEYQKIDEAYLLMWRVNIWSDYFRYRKRARNWKQRVATRLGRKATTLKKDCEDAEKLLSEWRIYHRPEALRRIVAEYEVRAAQRRTKKDLKREG
jgi:hypothetical protein